MTGEYYIPGAASKRSADPGVCNTLGMAGILTILMLLLTVLGTACGTSASSHSGGVAITCSHARRPAARNPAPAAYAAMETATAGSRTHLSYQPKPIPRWDVHFGEIDDDRKHSTAPHITFRPQLAGHR